MFGFRKCTRPLSRGWILSPQGRQQNLSLGINRVDNAEPSYPHDNIVGSHLCNECMTDWPLNVGSTNSLQVQAFFFKTICEHTFDNSPNDSSSLLELMINQARTSNFVHVLLCPFVCQFAISLNVFLSMSFHVVGPRYCLCVRCFPPWWFFSCSSRNTWFKHFFMFLNNDFIRFAFTLSTSQIYMVEKRCWFVWINAVHQFLPQPLWHSDFGILSNFGASKILTWMVVSSANSQYRSTHFFAWPTIS